MLKDMDACFTSIYKKLEENEANKMILNEMREAYEKAVDSLNRWPRIADCEDHGLLACRKDEQNA